MVQNYLIFLTLERPLRTTPSAGTRGLGVSYVTEGAAPNSRQRAGLQLLFRELKKNGSVSTG